MTKAKNGKAVDGKKAAAGDKPEPNSNGKVEKAQDVKIQTLTPANTKLVKRGFVKMFVDSWRVTLSPQWTEPVRDFHSKLWFP